ncbi:MAG: hypothetical protein R8L58_02920 [Mariprofundaceae bacterium]
MTSNESPRLITCIIPKGKAVRVMEKMKSEFGLLRAHVHLARGTAPNTPKALHGLVEHAEKEILEVIVEPQEADAMFGFLFESLHISEPYNGIMYMQPLGRATSYVLPEIPGKPEAD